MTTATPAVLGNSIVQHLRAARAGARPGDGTIRSLLDGEIFINEADGVFCTLAANGTTVTGNLIDLTKPLSVVTGTASGHATNVGQVGTAIATATASLASKVNPSFTGSVNVPTPTFGDDSTLAATTTFVKWLKNPLYYYGYVGTGICASGLALSDLYGTGYPVMLGTILSISGTSTVNAFTGTTTGPSGSGSSAVAGSPTITGLSSTTNVQVGQILTSCTNFPAGSQIISASGNSITLNNNATASGACSFNLSWSITQWQNIKPNAVALTDMICNPISTIEFFAGVNTTGYTLAQWQALVPQIKSLWDEVDGVAIQALINAASGPMTIELPFGVACTSWPLLSGRYELHVKGKGQFATSLIQSVQGQDGWHHGTSDTPYGTIYNSRLSLSDFGLQCSGKGGLAVSVAGTGNAGYFISNIQLYGVGNSGYNYWHDGVAYAGCSYVYITGLCIDGPQNTVLTNTGTAIAFTGLSTAQYMVRDSTVGWYQYALTATSGDNNGGHDMEGFVLDNFQANQIMYGVTVTYNGTSGYRSPQWILHDCQWNIFSQWLNIDHVSEINITNNLVYASTTTAYTGGLPKQPWIKLNAVSHMQFMNNSLEFGSGNNVAGIMTFAGACDTINIQHNQFNDYGSTMTYGLWNTDTSSIYILERNNSFESWQAANISSKIVGALNGATNRFETYFTQYGFELLSDGKASYTASFTGTTNSSGQLAVTLPPNMFINAPVVMACNGGTEVDANAVGIVNSSVTTSGFTAQFIGLASAIPVRVNFTTIGI